MRKIFAVRIFFQEVSNISVLISKVRISVIYSFKSMHSILLFHCAGQWWNHIELNRGVETGVFGLFYYEGSITEATSQRMLQTNMKFTLWKLYPRKLLYVIRPYDDTILTKAKEVWGRNFSEKVMMGRKKGRRWPGNQEVACFRESSRQWPVGQKEGRFHVVSGSPD